MASLAQPFPATLRAHRAARRISQLDLALDCGISARHLSFLESGRARPSRSMVLQLAEGLMLPLGARNAMMQAAGYAAAFPASALGSDELEPFRRILSDMMARHAPNPALLCDRHWTVLDANPSARLMLSALQGATAEANIVRLLADDALSSAVIVNLPEVLAEMAGRVRLEALEAPGDPVLAGLARLIEEARSRHPAKSDSARRPLVPFIIATPLGRLSFLSTIAHFGTSEDVTIRDLRLELLFPADDATRAAVEALDASTRR